MSIILKALDKIDEVERTASEHRRPTVEIVHSQDELPPEVTLPRKPQLKKSLIVLLVLIVALAVVLVVKENETRLTSLLPLILGDELPSAHLRTPQAEAMSHTNTGPDSVSGAIPVTRLSADAENKRLPVETVTSTTVSATQPKAGDTQHLMTINEPTPVIPNYAYYNWVLQGRSELLAGNREQAFKLWQEGLNSLSPKHRLVLISVYDLETSLYSRLDSYLPEGTAIGVRAAYRAESAYYLLGVTDVRFSESLLSSIQGEHAINAGFISVKTLLKNINQLSLLETPTNTQPVNEPVLALTQRVPNKDLAKNISGNRRESTRIVAPSVNPRQYTVEVARRLDHADFQGALTMLLNAKHYGDNDQERLYYLGTAYLGLGDLTQAEHYFSQLLTINSDLVLAWLQRTVIAQEQGDHELALKHLSSARLLDEGLPEIYLNYGYSYEQLGEYLLARDSYQYFLHLTGQRPEYYDVRKDILYRLENL